ncbi:TM2 domain-containing protein [Helicobacter fennelliae]|uniref:TM2 domain-containing protein n=1 Tax=Helicobacter fennelliae TaxID=215 RepID=A0A2X3DGU1_9HELI|nr:TM2 domain-containing protein [Helicobacter fennelliae]STP07016.1 TM2 domain-containing protein [Helicobacter fennelliae]STQ83437.1 TM2 domain-containing protein [Helicobacter fennelliae]
MYWIGLVWIIVDLFLVWKGIKKDNLNKILQALRS